MIQGTTSAAAPAAPLRQFLAQLAQARQAREAAGFELTPTNVREALAATTRRFVTQVPDVPLIRDTLIGGEQPDVFPVPVRVYHPEPGIALPVSVFAHGGGHVAGSVSDYEPIARKLCIAARRVLVSVDYRLAPECPYPAGLTDLVNVIHGVFPALARTGRKFTPRLAVVGDSGGGALTASAVHQLAAGTGIAIERQLLIYPGLDYTMSQPSMDELGRGYLLERDRVAWMFDQYFRHGEDRRATSPLFMPMPRTYPETLVVTAAFDPLKDEGAAYVARLKKHGVKAETMHFEGLIHAFLNLEDLVPDACDRLYREAGRFLAP